MRELDNWIAHYMNFSQNTESPPQYHLWTAISTIASCLQRKCWLEWGHELFYPNFYIALVGPPGGRKGTAMKILKPLVRDVGVSICSDAVGSKQALFTEFKDCSAESVLPDGRTIEHKSLNIWSEEFQVFLGEKNFEFLGAITDLFDCPPAWNYKSLKQGNIEVHNCFINIIGAITPSLLQHTLTTTAIGGGLISRIIFVVGYGPSKLVPLGFLSKEEFELKQKLMTDLEQIKYLSGPFIAEQEFFEVYADWYDNRCYQTKFDTTKFEGYPSRRATHLRKLCMVMSANEGNDMIIKPKHFNEALEILEYTEQYMPDAFHCIATSAYGETMIKIINLIKEIKRIEWKDLIRRTQVYVSPYDLKNYIETLITTGLVRKEQSITTTTYFYVEQLDNIKKSLENSFYKYLY